MFSYFITGISKIFEKKRYCAVLNFSINPLPSHHSTYNNIFPVAIIYRHVKVTFHCNFEREGAYLQALRMRDDAMMQLHGKKIVRRDWVLNL